MNLFSLCGLLFVVAAVSVQTTIGEDVLIKEGKCPLSSLPLRCPFQVKSTCVVDVDCEGIDKCCNDGCRLVCMSPTKEVLNLKNTERNDGVCETPLDLGFLIDSSASIGYKNFKKIQKVMQAVIEYYTISEHGTHVAAILIDGEPRLSFGFNTLKGKKLNMVEVQRLIQAMQYSKGKTRIDLALHVASKEMFSKLGGSRRNVRKVLVVFTDGMQTWEPALMTPLGKAAEALKRKGVQIFPVGFWTKELNVGSLMKIASDETIIFNMDFIPEFLDAMARIGKVKC